jgi:hypothetical protein
VTLISEVDDLVYNLDGSIVVLEPHFITTYESCPVTCNLYESDDDNGSYNIHKNRRSAVSGIVFNKATGSLTFRTKERHLTKKTIWFKIECVASDNLPFGRF